MINIENVEVMGFNHAIRGMRNPMNSWEKSDSCKCTTSCDMCDNFPVCNVNGQPYFKRFWESDPYDTEFAIGPNDHELMLKLAKAGTDHSKYRRMITVYLDITAPLYWWKEFDTYKVGTVANSCSTMHKIGEKKFTIEDFSTEYIEDFNLDVDDCEYCDLTDGCFAHHMMRTIEQLNVARKMYKATKDKKYWWQMIQLLPSSYNQKRTIMLNYEVLANMYHARKNHKLDEWREFCNWIESLPYSEIITCKKD